MTAWSPFLSPLAGLISPLEVSLSSVLGGTQLPTAPKSQPLSQAALLRAPLGFAASTG